MNEQDLAERKSLAQQHRNIQRFEGDIIAEEIQLEKERCKERLREAYERSTDLYMKNLNLRIQLAKKRRSVLEFLFGINRGN